MRDYICKDCIYFAPNYQSPAGNDFWCHRYNFNVARDTPSCPTYKDYEGIVDRQNSPYLGFIEREKDRKKGEYIKIILAGLIGIFGVLLGAILL